MYGRELEGAAQGRRLPITANGVEVNAYTINIASGSSITQPSDKSEVRNGYFGYGGWSGVNASVGGGQIIEATAKRADPFSLNGLGQVGPEIKKALVLTQLRYPANTPSSQEVTYTFEKPVYSFSMPIYDTTYVMGERDKRSYQAYRDVLKFSVPVVVSGSNASNLNEAGGSEFCLTEMVASSRAGANTDLVAIFTSSTPITSFKVTYTDNLTEYVGWQAIGLGPISTACPPVGTTTAP